MNQLAEWLDFFNKLKMWQYYSGTIFLAVCYPVFA